MSSRNCDNRFVVSTVSISTLRRELVKENDRIDGEVKGDSTRREDRRNIEGKYENDQRIESEVNLRTN